MTLEELKEEWSSIVISDKYDFIKSKKIQICIGISSNFESINKWRKYHIKSYLYMVNNHSFNDMQILCCKHMNYPDCYPVRSLIKHKIEDNEYKTVSIFRSKNSRLYDLIKTANELDFLRQKISNRQYEKHSYNGCEKEAIKYSTRSEWRKYSESTYRKAEREDWLPLLCKHMNNSLKGYDKQKTGILYILEVTSLLGCKWYKVGITNRSIKDRYTSKERKFIKVIKEDTYHIGQQPSLIELNIKRQLKGNEIPKNILPLDSGHSETFKTTKEQILDIYTKEKQKLKNIYTFSQLSLNL